MWERLRVSSAYYDGIMNVDDLSDEQFGALMDQVHTHFSTHTSAHALQHTQCSTHTSAHTV